ncbi:MAG: ATP synthase subunit I [Rhodoferax sp.]
MTLLPSHAFTLATPMVAGLAAGFAIGLAHFATLARNLRLFAAGRVAAAFALQLVRMAVTVACFVALAVLLGAGAVLASLAGLLLARTWLLRRSGAGT